MLYIMDEKDLGMIGSGELHLSGQDEVSVFVKDKSKPVLSADAFAAILSAGIGNQVCFEQAASKEELAFYVGGKVFGTESEITLVHMQVGIPAGFGGRVKVMPEKKKPAARKPAAKKPAAPKAVVSSAPASPQGGNGDSVSGKPSEGSDDGKESHT